ncbi:MAG: type II toxin-antitoxin system VapC family toxin [Methylacidiphilales bacterium]|nr:type II toxin-antitoxin system VapC family toxin [Candidatus Methylacidiphilales bacterium]
MNAVAVDTSILLAIFKGEPKGGQWLERLHKSAETSTLLVSSVVLAELRSFFPHEAACSNALRALEIRHSALSEDAALLAGKIFRQYRSEGGPRRTILPDFLVAAHAATQAGALATDDRGYLRSYFPALKILTLN